MYLIGSYVPNWQCYVYFPSTRPVKFGTNQAKRLATQKYSAAEVYETVTGTCDCKKLPCHPTLGLVPDGYRCEWSCVSSRNPRTGKRSTTAVRS